MEEQDVGGEACEMILGTNNLGHVLVVIYTTRGGKIRIISARKATGNEVEEYESRI